MIPLLSGVQPAQNTAQSTNGGPGDGGSAFGDLLASILPAGQGTAQAPDDAAPETPETKTAEPAGQVPTGTGNDGFADQQIQARMAVPVPNIVPVQAATAAIFAPEDSSANAAPADPAPENPPGSVAPGGSAMPMPLVGAPELGAPVLGTSAPAIPPVAVPATGAPVGSAAAVGTDPGVISLANPIAPDEPANIGGNGRQPAAEPDGTAAVSADEAPADARGPVLEPGSRPAGPAPESKPPQVAPSTGFQVPVSHSEPPASRTEALTGVGAVAGGRTIAVENVVSREPQAPPINRQLVGRIASLAAGPHGERTVSVNIAPEALGPVTVKAHLGHEGLRVELSAPTEAGREALRAMLPELRRDLAATGAGTVGISTATDAGTGTGTYSGGGQASMANDQRFGGGAAAGQGRRQGEEAAPPPAQEPPPTAHASSHLDVMA